jgi:hypothetical protein
LTDKMQVDLQKQLDDYLIYLDKVGFQRPVSRVTIRIDKLPGNSTAYYSNNKIFIDVRAAADPHIAIREYNHHILQEENGRPWQGQYGAIESGLADYYACSYSDTPRFGEISARALGSDQPYFHILDNQRKFGEFATGPSSVQIPWWGTEIWGGAFWAMRSSLGRDLADRIAAKAWLSIVWPTEEAQQASTFVDALVSAAKSIGDAQAVEVVRKILREREFPLGQ